MTNFKLDHAVLQNERLPSFEVTLKDSEATAIYSDTDTQVELIKALEKHGELTILDQKDGLYERLTIENNVKFYHKWFGCKTPLPEILVRFELQYCAKTTLKKASASEIRRVHFAKYCMMNASPCVFREPIHGVDVITANTFSKLLQNLKDREIPVLILLSNMEHARLLGDVSYKLQKKGLHEIECDKDVIENASGDTSRLPATAPLYKIPAKVDDKVILFDPPEIDYIESQDGTPMIVVEQETFAMDSTLAEMEKKLEVYGFYRCHRSYIVNLQKVREIITWSKNAYSLKIDNKDQTTIPLSRTKIQDIQEKFNLQ